MSRDQEPHEEVGGQMELPYSTDDKRAMNRVAFRAPREIPHGEIGSSGKIYFNSDTSSVKPRRPEKKGEQLPLAGMPEPTDAVLHALRQENPKLNEYQFRTRANKTYGSSEVNQVNAIHYDGLVHPKLPEGIPPEHRFDILQRRHNYGEEGTAGVLEWATRSEEQMGGPYGDESRFYNPHEPVPGHITWVNTRRGHGGKGLATAMWDYAQANAHQFDSFPAHDTNRSEAGNLWAHWVGNGPHMMPGSDPIPRQEGQKMAEY